MMTALISGWMLQKMYEGPGAGKAYLFRRSTLVQAKIKARSFIDRKYVVEERVLIRKEDGGPNRHYQQMRRKMFVFLDQTEDLLLRLGGFALGRGQPHHRARGRANRFSVLLDDHFS